MSECLSLHFLFFVTGKSIHVAIITKVPERTGHLWLCTWLDSVLFDLLSNKINFAKLLSQRMFYKTTFTRNTQKNFCFPQTRLRKMVPDGDCEATARKLGKILQKTEAVQDVQALLLQAHKQADRLFTPGFPPISSAPCSDWILCKFVHAQVWINV